MRKMEYEELEQILNERKDNEKLELRDLEFDDMDLSESSVKNAQLDGCSLRSVNFQNAEMWGACMRGCDMTGCNICGANLYAAVLENAILTDVKADENTKWYRLRCPETGAFVAYKKCVYDRIVQLLVPADAKRTSSTYPACRCNKAKVLTIKSFDETEEFDEAWSLVDENFVYRKGQWVEVKDFNEDRWFDSTTGIHFWMNREEAMKY